jgi:hypothetical protein
LTEREPGHRKSKEKMSFSVNLSEKAKIGKKNRTRSKDEKSQESVSINMNLIM